MGLPAPILAILFAVGRRPWYLAAALLLFCVWAAFGYVVDCALRVRWRSRRDGRFSFPT